MTTAKQLARQLVKKGASIFDEKLPSWPWKIELYSLNMSDGCKCVLGQIGGEPVNLDRLTWDDEEFQHEWVKGGKEELDYDGMLSVLGVSDGPENGFNMGDVEYRDDIIHVAYSDLQEAWTQEIKERRGEV